MILLNALSWPYSFFIISFGNCLKPPTFLCVFFLIHQWKWASRLLFVWGPLAAVVGDYVRQWGHCTPGQNRLGQTRHQLGPLSIITQSLNDEAETGIIGLHLEANHSMWLSLMLNSPTAMLLESTATCCTYARIPAGIDYWLLNDSHVKWFTFQFRISWKWIFLSISALTFMRNNMRQNKIY